MFKSFLKQNAAFLFCAAGLVSLAVFSHRSLPANPKPLSDFVLFASEELKLEKSVQVSSGDLGSNKELDIQKDVIISGNLFADKITIDKNTVINGNVSYTKLKAQKDVQIFGTQTKSISLCPLPFFPIFPIFQLEHKISASKARTILSHRAITATLPWKNKAA